MTVKLEREPTATERPLIGLDEAALLSRIKAGEVLAYEEIMRRNNRRLFRLAYAVSQNDAEAEDVLQESYLKAYQSIATFDGRARLSTWLARITLNEAIDRQRRHRPTVPLSLVVGGKEEKTIADYDHGPWPQKPASPEQQAARGEVRRLLEEAIAALPSDFRVVFTLRALDGFSVEETAGILGLSKVTVRTRFFRAKARMKKALAQELEGTLGEAFPFAGERCDRIVDAVATRIGGR